MVLLRKLVYALIIEPWLRYIIGVTFEHRHVFEDVNQFIVVANHNSHFDIVSIIAALPYKKMAKIKTAAASDYFGTNPFKRFLLNFFFSTVFIDRNHNNPHHPSAIDQLDELLKSGHSLVLFPEGSRGRPGVISEFKTGIAVLLRKNPNIPFIPVYLDGFGRVLPKDSMLIIPLRCHVRFGYPIHVKGDDIEKTTEEVRHAILSLKKSDERDKNSFENTTQKE